MLWSSTSRLFIELTIHDSLYPIYEKQDNICSSLSFRVYMLHVTQSTTRAFEYIYGVKLSLYSKLRQNYRVNDFVMKKSINININYQININENSQMCRMVSGICNMFTHIFNNMYMRIQSGRHSWIVMCRLSDNDCLIIYTVHVGLRILSIISSKIST